MELYSRLTLGGLCHYHLRHLRQDISKHFAHGGNNLYNLGRPTSAWQNLYPNNYRNRNWSNRGMHGCLGITVVPRGATGP